MIADDVRFFLIRLVQLLQRATLWAILIVFALWITHVYGQRSHFGANDFPLELTSPHAIHFIPLIAEILDYLIPSAATSALGNLMMLYGFLPKAVGESAFPVFSLAVFVCVLGYAITMRKLGDLLFPGNGAGWISGTLALYTIPSLAYPELHYFDFAFLFFLAAAVYALLRQRMQIYLVFFALAAFNDLKIGWLILYFLLYQHKISSQKSDNYFLIGTQIMLLGIAGFYMILRTPGDSVYFLLPDFALSFASFLYAYDFTKLIIWCLGALLFTYRFAEKPLALRLAFWLAIPYGILYFNHAPEYGLRLFYGIHPFLILIVVHSITAVMREGKIFTPEAERSHPL